ncbi:MAG: hypothetical protein ABJA18_03890 [bacterium]
MKKTLILISIAVAVAVAGILTYTFVRDTSEITSTSSPNNKYTVRISQERPLPGIERYVYLNVARGGESLLKRKLLYTGDMLDDEFNGLYPNHSWLSESILRIGRGDGAQSDTIQISNNSSARIKYLLIETYEDKFILLDVEPGAVVNQAFRYVGRLSCQGEFSESGKRFGDAIELSKQGGNAAHNQFLISLKEDGLSIESPQQAVNHSRCCAVDRPDIDHE